MIFCSIEFFSTNERARGASSRATSNARLIKAEDEPRTDAPAFLSLGGCGFDLRAIARRARSRIIPSLGPRPQRRLRLLVWGAR
jgi:hypothetical protein